MIRFIHELEEWPRLHWDQERMLLSTVRLSQDGSSGEWKASGLIFKKKPFSSRSRKTLWKAAALKGDCWAESRCVLLWLGMDAYALVPANRTVEGVVEMMLDAIRLYGEPLTKERLLGRQAALFSTGREEAEDRV